MAIPTTKVMYDSNRLIPAPFVSISKQYQRTQDQTPIGSTFRITLNGQVLAFMGSPVSNRTFWDQPEYPADENIAAASRLKSILRKQEAIRDLFSTDGLLFEIQSGDGSAPLKCNPRVLDIEFREGLWYDIFEYTITLEADIVYINGQALGEDSFTELISDASETWDFETDETPQGIDKPRTYRLTHTVSATGKRFFDETGTLVKQAWEQAKDYVVARLGYSPSVAENAGVNTLPGSYGGYNFIRSSQQDSLGGIYSVTESWLLAEQPYLEEFTCDIKSDISTGTTGVTIQGTITGLEQRDANVQLVTTKYANASTAWATIEANLLSRAQSYAGVTLNINPLSKLVGKNEIAGIITYAYEYDTRPSNIFVGSLYEGITLTENLPADLFASIPVVGRANGPVLQYLGSIQERSVVLNIEVVFPPSSFGGGSISEVRAALYGNPRISQPNAFNTIIQAARPALQYGTSIQLTRSQNETWDARSGRYNYSIEWVFGN